MINSSHGSNEMKDETISERLLPFLKRYAEGVKAKFESEVDGEPEDQLRAPIENLFEAFGALIGRSLVLKGESRLAGRLGRPDFAVLDGPFLVGYIEVKAPGKGVEPKRFRDHDLDQWERFSNVPNILYTDGIEWTVYRSGEREGRKVVLDGSLVDKGGAVIDVAGSRDLFQLFAAFSSWSPIVPRSPKDLAAFLAPYCRLIRDEALEALSDDRSALCSLRYEIKRLLFPEATDNQFADAYAQTLTFALILAHLEGADVRDLTSAYQTLETHHLLLSRSLQFLTDREALKEISFSVDLARRVIHEIDPATLKAEEDGDDPWLFFYEHFLAGYDPRLRKEWGVYYTPVEVVRCQVRLVDEILSKHLGKEMGFVEPGVITLDPALGTGTYLLGIIDHSLRRIREEEGPGAVRGGARSLMTNLHGFEWMVGPYAVAQLRFAKALSAHGATLPPSGIGVYLTNTLESPHAQPPTPPLFHKPIALEHERALRIKDAEHVLVCLGNPPYGRHDAVTEDNHAVTGGWVRHGRDEQSDTGDAILEDFIAPARRTGLGVHLKNLYNQYVYFLRWALWKTFEHKSAVGPGVVSFITASSYLDGPAFVGVREHLRKICERIDIIDLGGEGRGTRKTENVFAIQTPVCIVVAWRKGRKKGNAPATVRYTCIEGTREEKLAALAGVKTSRSLSWQEVSSGWQAPFKPEVKGGYADWPSIADLFPWQQSGVELKRSWPIGSDPELLGRRWGAFVAGHDRVKLFRESRDRKITRSYPGLPPFEDALPPLCEVGMIDMLEPCRYSFRAFDREWVLPDNRLGDFFRPVLWKVRAPNQVYFTSLFNHPLGRGPALTCCAHVPDRHYFRGSYGGKDVMPLYRDAAGHLPNILPGLLDLLRAEYGKSVFAEDFAGYVYCLLAQPEYTARFAKELAGKAIRVPLTRDGALFFEAAELGKTLVWLHTYGERFIGKGRPANQIHKGKARCVTAISESKESYPNEFSYDKDTCILRVGDGEFSPVQPEVFSFEVSGFKVVESWLGYRMRDRKGKKSSPLDDIRPSTWSREMTRELLELLWVLEATVALRPKQERILDEVLSRDLLSAKGIPKPSNGCRGPANGNGKKNSLQQELIP